jgi:transcriptional regulator with XRE-family HTH domain
MMRAIVVEPPAHTVSRLRRARGLSRADACRLGRVSPSTWRAIESGATERPRAGTKVRIARALGVTPSRIWRQGPAPLHLEDLEDPRWESAVRGLAGTLAEQGSVAERRRFGEHLAAVLDSIEPGDGPDSAHTPRLQELWEIAGALALGTHSGPIALIDGRLVESDRHTLTGAKRSPDVRVRRTRRGAAQNR